LIAILLLAQSGAEVLNYRVIEVSRHFILRICILIGHYRR
jgi:hypothetical protein